MKNMNVLALAALSAMCLNMASVEAISMPIPSLIPNPNLTKSTMTNTNKNANANAIPNPNVPVNPSEAENNKETENKVEENIDKVQRNTNTDGNGDVSPDCKKLTTVSEKKKKSNCFDEIVKVKE